MNPHAGTTDSTRDLPVRLIRNLAPCVAAATLGVLVWAAPSPALATEGGLLQSIAGAAAQAADAVDGAAAGADEAAVPADQGADPAAADQGADAAVAGDPAAQAAPEEAAPAEEGTDAADAPAGENAGAVQESGISFTPSEGMYFAEDEWWTYLTDTSALYFQTHVVDASSGPDMTLGAPDDAWAQTFLGEDGYDYLGGVAYDNATVSFYTYFFYDGTSPDTPYVDFRAYVPLADGSATAIAGFMRSDDLDAMLNLVDALMKTVELAPDVATGADPAVTDAAALTCGAFSFTLPEDVDFDLSTAEDGSIAGTFAGPVDACELMVFSIDTDGVVITSTDELQQAGDAFMSGVGEGAADADGQVLSGSVLSNDQSVAYYQANYISGAADASFALLPYNGTMTIVCIFDTGSADDFAFANEVLFDIANSAVLSGGTADAADAAGSGDLAAIAESLGEDVQLV